MRFTRGFTLVEVLVVIVVIAAIVSISGINTGSDPRDNFVKTESSRLKFFLESFTDEAILNSKNIGIYFTRSGASPYQWQKAPETDDNQSGDTKEKWKWVAYQSSRIENFKLQDEIEFRLFMNKTEIPLDFEVNDKKELTPHIIIQSSGIQTLVNINLSIDGFDKSITVKGNGAGRYKVGALINEFE